MILIKSIKIIDGTGQSAFKGDILIKGDKISAIGNFPNKQAEVVIDGLGLIATPGFIDANADSDHYLGLFTNPLQKDFLLQGVTTIIGGQCGSSLAPLMYGSLKSIRKWADTDLINVDWTTVADLKKLLNRIKLGVNFGTLVGHSTVRRDISGEEIRDLTESEFEIFENSLSNALKNQALGLSTGLGYSHSRYIPYNEIKRLLFIVAKYGRVYATHLKNEKEGIAESVAETINMAKDTGVPVIISHFRPLLSFEAQFQEALQIIEKNLDKANVYFDTNSSDISILPVYSFLPAWAQQNGFERMLEIISDKDYRRKILEELRNSDIRFDALIIAKAKNNPYIVGKTIKEFAENRGLDAYEGILALMEITKTNSQVFYKNLNTEILNEIIAHPRAIIGSNSASLPDSQLILKPERAQKTFVRFFEIMKDKKISLEESIKNITAKPAKFFGLQKRGLLREGWFADMAILKDTEVINVMVNGQLTVQDKAVTGHRGGQAI